MRSTFPSCLLPWACCLVLLLAGGCGYTAKELFPQDVRTVAVPIFDNRTFYQGVEFDLTEALKKQLELRTPYKVTSVSTADTELRGTITRIDQDQLSRRRPGGLPQEMQVSISVDFEWKDLRENETLRDRRGFVAVGRYVPTDPLLEPFEIAQHQAVERLASEIVSVMRADW